MISEVFREDIYQIVSSAAISWEVFKSATVLITGATGLVGSALVHTLSFANSKHGLDLRIIAHGRNASKCEALSQDCGVEFVCGDIRKPLLALFIADKVDYIFHCAAITKSADMVAKPAEVIDTATDGTRNALELARTKRSRSVVYLSSMEVYGQTALKEVTEADLGYLDSSNPRSSYPVSKRLCESLCNCYFEQYGVPVKIARLAQTFGAGTPKDDPRVFAQFARSVINGENIVLHTEGKSRGNYCYIGDTIRGLLLLLLRGNNGEIYNIANIDASMTICEMARLVANEVCGGKVSVVVDVPPDIAKCGYAPDVGFRLNADKIKKLGWAPRYGLAEMHRRLLADWQEAQV